MAYPLLPHILSYPPLTITLGSIRILSPFTSNLSDTGCKSFVGLKSATRCFAHTSHAFRIKRPLQLGGPWAGQTVLHSLVLPLQSSLATAPAPCFSSLLPRLLLIPTPCPWIDVFLLSSVQFTPLWHFLPAGGHHRISQRQTVDKCVTPSSSFTTPPEETPEKCFPDAQDGQTAHLCGLLKEWPL